MQAPLASQLFLWFDLGALSLFILSLSLCHSLLLHLSFLLLLLSLSLSLLFSLVFGWPLFLLLLSLSLSLYELLVQVSYCLPFSFLNPFLSRHALVGDTLFGDAITIFLHFASVSLSLCLSLCLSLSHTQSIAAEVLIDLVDTSPSLQLHSLWRVSFFE